MIRFLSSFYFTILFFFIYYWNNFRITLYISYSKLLFTRRKKVSESTMKEKEIYFTVNAVNMFHGIKPFKIGSLIKLVKEPENDYDMEAIRVELRYAGKSGYVANSVKTVAKGTYSAGRLYDKILENDYGQVQFIIGDVIIAKVLYDEEISKQKEDADSDINFI